MNSASRRFRPLTTLLALWAALTSLSYAIADTAPEEWPQFRGPTGQGHAAGAPPTLWSETKNVVWKTAVPGRGWSCPVAGGGRVYGTSALQDGRSLRAWCVEQTTGKIVFDVEVIHTETPPPINAVNSHASPTPVLSDGRLYVYYGTSGAGCVDAATGEVLWTNTGLPLDHKEGPGSSAIAWGDFMIFNCDGMDVQYVAALDKKTGKVAWKAPRTGKISENPDKRKAYSTPLVIDVAGEEQLVSAGADRLVAYAPADGKELWRVEASGFSNVPRPVYADGVIYFSTGFVKPQLWAVKPGGRGDLTTSNVVWKYTKGVPANSSPLYVAGSIYMVADNGVASCIDAATGE
ncbi:MAG: PQQ-binding-like beta-propeller repeat protein, partial [Planctomycetia bacterium]